MYCINQNINYICKVISNEAGTLNKKTMTKVTLKTIGAAPSETMEFDSKKLADFFQEEISGYPATEVQAAFVTQKFVDTFDIKAKYSGGTFMGFKASEEAEEEFETFKKK